MDFRDTPEEARFRQEVREFIEREAPVPDGAERDPWNPAPELRQWFQKLSERRWIAPAWPKEYGGAGLTVMQQFILNEEMALHRAPRPSHLAPGVGLVGPTLIVHGTEEQKQKHLPRILSGEDVWCQGYSEPGAGSDLASLQTRAVRDGDEYVINGQKIWTSFAQQARWMILLARTDPDAPKHKGITYFIVDMQAPGIAVRPLINMAGTHEFNEVFFEDVRVPRENIIGEENRGWYTAVTTLDFERSSIATTIGNVQAVEDIIAFAKEHRAKGVSTLDWNPALKHELVDRLVEANIARVFSYRIITMQNRGEVPNHESSVAKLYSSELNQRIARTALKVPGLYGQLDRGSKEVVRGGRWLYRYLRTVANTIEGGTSEIQRNIIAQRGLGLPRS